MSSLWFDGPEDDPSNSNLPFDPSKPTVKRKVKKGNKVNKTFLASFKSPIHTETSGKFKFH